VDAPSAADPRSVSAVVFFTVLNTHRARQPHQHFGVKALQVFGVAAGRQGSCSGLQWVQ
jgi:hypothetical protein